MGQYSQTCFLLILLLLSDLELSKATKKQHSDSPRPRVGEDELLKQRAGGDGPEGGAGSKRKLKILVNNPGIAWSHVQFNGRLADVLADAGHEVASNPTVANYTGTSRGQRIWRMARKPGKENDFLNIKFMKSLFDGPTNMLTDGALNDWMRVLMDMCDELVDNHELLDQLREEHFDVALSECLHTCAFGVFKHIGVHTSLCSLSIGLNSFNTHHFGIPSFPSWETNLFCPAPGGPVMNFWERARTFYIQLLDTFVMRPFGFAQHKPLFERAFGSDFPAPADLMRNVSLIFTNENEFFDLPHLISHKVITIGGIVEAHTDASPSARAAKIIDKSQSGVVLFSLGTMGNASEMPERMKRSFLNAFAHFPNYEFIWKYKVHEGEVELFRPENIPPNVHLFEWVEQKALLQHPRMRAFITHCGLNSVNEAARAGVPVIGIPLFAEQHYNAALMNSKGVGVLLWDVRECANERTMINALKEVLENPIYAHNAKLVSRKLRLSPFSPTERFVRWVEFAADYPELNELNLPYHEFSFLTYYCLDVIAFTLVGLAVAIALIYWAFKWMISNFFCKFCSAPHSGSIGGTKLNQEEGDKQKLQ